MPSQDDPNLPTRFEISNVIKAVQDALALRERIAERVAVLRPQLRAAKPGSARWHYVRGLMDERGMDRSRAIVEYGKAMQAEAVKPSLTEAEARHLVNHYVGGLAFALPDADARRLRDRLAAGLFAPQTPPFKRWAALVTLEDRLSPKDLGRLCEAVIGRPENGTDADRWLHQEAKKVLALATQANEAAAVELLKQDAVAAEVRSDWTAALGKYRAVTDYLTRVPDLKLPGSDRQRILAQADRSIMLLNMVVQQMSVPDDQDGMAGDAPHCRFLGVDRTIGDDWRASVGDEAWVLIGAHESDVVGGPMLVNGSFNYRVDVGDPANATRRWRDPAGYQSRPSDLRLTDPTTGAGEAVKSFADDNGEQYPGGGGPDLYVDLTIPAGNHILSLPLHYSEPKIKDATYGFYLFSSEKGGAGVLNDPDALCMGSLVVPDTGVPGYVRVAVRGPLRCTVVIRRLNSLNANLPGIFLDSDQRSQDPGRLTAACDGVADSGLSFTPGDKDAALKPFTDRASALQALVTSYVSGGTDWAAMAKSGSKLSQDATLPDVQRTIAAFIAWRSAERDPLQAGGVTAAYYRYLACRYPESFLHDSQYTASDADELERWRAELLADAQSMRDAGRLRLAEVADDMAWNCGARSLEITYGLESANNPAVMNTVYKYLWNEGPRHYLASQEVWSYQGEGGPEKQALNIALDAQYAARLARCISRAAAASDVTLASLRLDPITNRPLLEDAVPPAADFDAAGPAASRMWIDDLAQGMGLNINGLKPWDSADAGGRREQTSADVVYAAACAPLLGDAAPRPEPRPQFDVPSDPARIPPSSIARATTGQALPKLAVGEEKARPCLLRADQMEILAHAYLDRDMYPTDYRASDVARAAIVLAELKARYPNYEHMDQVEPMLASLTPKK